MKSLKEDWQKRKQFYFQGFKESGVPTWEPNKSCPETKTTALFPTGCTRKRCITEMSLVRT